MRERKVRDDAGPNQADVRGRLSSNIGPAAASSSFGSARNGPFFRLRRSVPGDASSGGVRAANALEGALPPTP